MTVVVYILTHRWVRHGNWLICLSLTDLVIFLAVKCVFCFSILRLVFFKMRFFFSVSTILNHKRSSQSAYFKILYFHQSLSLLSGSHCKSFNFIKKMVHNPWVNPSPFQTVPEITVAGQAHAPRTFIGEPCSSLWPYLHPISPHRRCEGS